jgi:voltage-gated potassium channel
MPPMAIHGAAGRSHAATPQAAPWRFLRLWLLVVAGAFVVGSVGYILIGGWSLSDAFYMTAITLTTVGFREVRELDEPLRIWTSIVAIAGVGIIFGTVGIITEELVRDVTSGRREAKRVADELAGMRDHFVLCGYGRVGSTVAREMAHEGHRLVVIDGNEPSLEHARRDGLLVMAGDATDDATLLAAGIDRARGLIATMDSDANNVYVILSARALNPRLFIVGRASTAEAEAKLARAGADRVVSPYTMAGQRLAELASRPRVVDFLDQALSHGQLAFSLEELSVGGSSLADRDVAALRRDGIFVLAIVHGDSDYEANPPDGRVLREGEIVIISGPQADLRRLAGRTGSAGGV